NEKLGLNAFGKDALGSGLHINRPEDLYLRAVANLGTSENGGVPMASKAEQEAFSKARRHLDKSVFDEDKWKKIVGKENWAQVVYVLNRGGRFQEHSKGLSGKMLANKYGKLLNLYQEKTASKKYSGTGKSYYGYPKYVPLAQFDGKPLDKLADGYDLTLITHRTITQTKSRTNGAYWLTAIEPDNGIIISNQDASRLGLKAGDKVRVVSATNKEGVYDLKHGNKKEMIGKVIPTEGIRPGVISFTLGFGNWASGATDMLINGEVVAGDERRGKGIMANAAMWTDPSLNNNTCLVDPVGGSVSFYDTKVNLIKV
ncbi:MAG: molybdopterin dinucleotide binding domain-containing protein, partial [Flavobacteriaceae bacterium]|nr:molybdopterin dinucleotide binding domain-containing protein [Flavobacteriaceae bacterium]